MIVVKSGDLLQSKARFLVCPVNTVGVMGAGLAKQMAKAIPGLEERYKRLCSIKMIKTGEIEEHTFGYVYGLVPERGVLMLPTKQDWRDPSKIEWIDQGLAVLSDRCWRRWRRDRPTIALPKIGCGKGQLDWEKDVEHLVYYHLHNAPATIELYL